MRVFQINGNCSYGDAIGNNIVLMKKYMADAGYTTEIFTQSIDKRWPKGTGRKLSQMPRIRSNDVLIYHYSANNPLNLEWIKNDGFHIMMFHNVTPPEFFLPFDTAEAGNQASAILDLPKIKDRVDKCIVFSEFSKNDLLMADYKSEKISIMPSYLIPFEDYSNQPDAETVEMYSDGYINILFVGRIAPNKKQEDVIRAFAEYKKNYNFKSRLILVGRRFGKAYSNHIDEYIKKIGVQDVILPAHVSFPKLISFYKTAHVFLCLSEHEGFCVPLVESMYFNVPIIAYDKSAIPETLDGSGVLIDDKDPVLVASIIDKIVSNEAVGKAICSKQRERLNGFEARATAGWLVNYLKELQREMKS